MLLQKNREEQQEAMEERKENIMGTQPMSTLLPGMAVPIMLSMLVQALYNVVDSIFVSMVSETRSPV